MKLRTGWKPGMEQRTADNEGRQVKCLIASEGHQWMCSYYDRLPPSVRYRLRVSPFNVCPACLTEEAHNVAGARGLRRPTVKIYLDVIAAIERKLK
jgi:hypothetical protein